jgi:1-acyl-sn-glycerol-3-phosphate acyltransferase
MAVFVNPQNVSTIRHDDLTKGSLPRQTSPPVVSPLLSWGFRGYVPRYLRRHFNAVRVAKGTAPKVPSEASVLCFANHAAWWDPLVAFLLNELYCDGRTVYAPIDQQALARYPVFAKLGFYGIELSSLEGARRFLSVTRELLENPETAIWMTPGGKFADVREKTTFQPGLGHIACSLRNVYLVPVALEYTFWEERTPEALVAFGEPLQTGSVSQSKSWWQTTLEDRLAEAQLELAEKSISRDYGHFDVILDGRGGVGGWYGHWRRFRSMMGGRSFDPRHHQSPSASPTHV